MVDERAKYGPIPVSDKAKAEEDAKRAIEEAEKAAQVRNNHAVSNRLSFSHEKIQIFSFS